MIKDMGREILFRGKSKKTGEWFFGNLFDKDNSGKTHIGTTTKGCFDIDPETVGQFTGLIDKNDKRIYDGDIVINKNLHSKKWAVEYRTDSEYVGFVLVEVGKSGISYFTSWAEVEIMGNIHDNPELI